MPNIKYRRMQTTFFFLWQILQLSLPNLLREFEQYGAISNLKINFYKSAAMGIKIAPALLTSLKSSFKFKWTDSALKYLSTYIPSKIAHTYDLNFPLLLTRTRILLDVKSRLPRRLLSLPKHYGGLALPDVRKYYQATHLDRFIDWSRHYNTKLWAQLEQAQTYIPLKGALWCSNNLPLVLKAHPLLGTTLCICSGTIFTASLSTHASPCSSILGNPAFSPGLGSPEFKTLLHSGWDRASHFLIADRWPSITALMSDTGPF